MPARSFDSFLAPPFSGRVRAAVEQNRIADILARRTAEGRAHLDLTQSNPTEAGLEYPEQEILRAVADPHALRYRPSAFGLTEAREAVAEYYGAAVDPAHLLLTASTSEAYSYVFKLLCDPGDEILAPRPSYPLFEFRANLEGVGVRQYPMRYHAGWFIDVPALESAVTDRTRAIVFVHPNNPTGSYLKPEEHAAITELCHRHRLAFLVDEVFLDYAFHPGAQSHAVIPADALTFTLSGLSKVAALPQLKLGWMAVGGPPPLRNAALARLELIADTFLSVGAPVQHATRSLLELRFGIQAQIRERTAANLAYLRAAVAPTALRTLDMEGGWYAIVHAPRVRSEEDWILHLLERCDTLVQPGFFFDFETEPYLVLSLLTEAAIFREGVDRLVSAAAIY